MTTPKAPEAFHFAAPEQSPEYYRQVNGVMTTRTVQSSASVRLETISLQPTAPVDWRIRQPALSLLWWRTGIQGFEIETDGEMTRIDNARRGLLGIIPPGIPVKALFHTDPFLTYHVAFIDTALFEDKAQFLLDRPLIGFSDTRLEQSLAQLQDWRDDATFPLMAQGWALQTIARLQVALEAPDRGPPVARGGLPPHALRQIETYVMERLHEPIGLHELAGLVGISVRHFARAFLQATCLTPARFVFERRVAHAKEMLADRAASITDIAMACGFSHSQHFANSFRRATGTTPSAFRKALLG
ncbi:helix-turn-helix transcriptional regulator [Sphingomonas sp. TDK1]|uniref:helix-turn-helix transcriptional regulator n=1 Tax=Sphingomonas sp. TDK1 TaxID=453247 RepID=UPI0007D93D4A|nr:AraC family transcriptional regulator [Sphingomonas sp. TDK1]OAN58363.1 hypothetical protein A7X12_04710 [Sphingomonas sp. TDK1]